MSTTPSLTRAERQKATQPIRTRKYTLKKFGMTLASEEQLLSFQRGACAICKTTHPGDKKKFWSIDHDHTTGAVRGLLCHNCNCMLGHARDNPEFLRAAAGYLKQPPASIVLH